MNTNPALLPSLVGRQIGWLRVNKPIVNLNRGYECAAWWQEETSALGVFPLYLRENYYRKGHYYASAKLPAKVTDCDFTSLFCGNPIGKYDKTRDLGREASISYVVELPKLVATTGSPNLDGVDFCPLWEHVPAIIAYWQDRARYWLDVANKALAGDCFASSVRDIFSTLGHYALWAGEHASQASEMARYLGYQTEVGDSWRKLFAKNYDWIPAPVTA